MASLISVALPFFALVYMWCLRHRGFDQVHLLPICGRYATVAKMLRFPCHMVLRNRGKDAALSLSYGTTQPWQRCRAFPVIWSPRIRGKRAKRFLYHMWSLRERGKDAALSLSYMACGAVVRIVATMHRHTEYFSIA